MNKPERIPPETGQESVWDYPRPPRVEGSPRHIKVILGGIVIAETCSAWRILEMSHPPVYYIPLGDVMMDHLLPINDSSWCEWKGAAVYYDLVAGSKEIKKGAWSYPKPARDYQAIAGHIAFYAWAADQCLVDGEIAKPQPGRFYGGWITKDIVGPFKGEPGSVNW